MSLRRLAGALGRGGLGFLVKRHLAVALLEQLHTPPELLGQLLGPQQTRVRAETEHPRDHAAWARVAGQEDPVSLGRLLAADRLRIGLTDLAVATEVAFDLPGDPL